jgi:AcrR family transcriptional regulator
MARPVSISADQIVDAARIVFERDGVNATTRDIARQAGISEGTIFNHFPTRSALLAAAVKPPDVPLWVQTMESLVGVGEVRQNLAIIAREMVRFTQTRLPLLIVSWSSRLEKPAGTEGEEPPAPRDRRRLAAYLKTEADAGRLRPCNTEAVAQLLFGACVSYAIDDANRRLPDAAEHADAFVSGLIGAVWPGIDPENPEGEARSSRPPDSPGQ